jgi:hypothetical protein
MHRLATITFNMTVNSIATTPTQLQAVKHLMMQGLAVIPKLWLMMMTEHWDQFQGLDDERRTKPRRQDDGIVERHGGE